jgi:hypothetical protein
LLGISVFRSWNNSVIVYSEAENIKHWIVMSLDIWITSIIVKKEQEINANYLLRAETYLVINKLFFQNKSYSMK